MESKNKLKMRKNLFSKEKLFFNKLKKIIKSQPYFVIIVLHEYFRNIYPSDPHIKFKNQDAYSRINNKLDELLEAIKIFSSFGVYSLNFDFKKNRQEIKKKTGALYGDLWEILTKEENLRAKDFIIKRFKKNINVKNYFKNKIVLDVGCGDGRYSHAICQLGAKKVYGIDYGTKGLSIGRKIFKTKKLTLKQADALKIPFKDNTFDFVWNSGVAHHTTNFEKAIKELVRVCKDKGQIYFYVYGKGGILWSSRRKMNELIKNNIPQEYSQQILNMIGMPSNRWIFMDNWYVPIERHNTYSEVIKIFNKLGVRKIEKIKSGRSIDLHIAATEDKNGELIWGNGEIRLLITK